MSDESRTEFQLWAETEFINGPLQYHGMYRGWHARDAEIEALKARVDALGLHADELAAALKEDQADVANSAGAWVPVGESLPIAIGYYYVLDNGVDEYVAMLRKEGGWVVKGGWEATHPTHWLDIRHPTG